MVQVSLRGNCPINVQLARWACACGVNELSMKGHGWLYFTASTDQNTRSSSPNCFARLQLDQRGLRDRPACRLFASADSCVRVMIMNLWDEFVLSRGICSHPTQKSCRRAEVEMSISIACFHSKHLNRNHVRRHTMNPILHPHLDLQSFISEIRNPLRLSRVILIPTSSSCRLNFWPYRRGQMAMPIVSVSYLFSISDTCLFLPIFIRVVILIFARRLHFSLSPAFLVPRACFCSSSRTIMLGATASNKCSFYIGNSVCRV